MRLLRKFSKKGYSFRQIAAYFLTCWLFFGMSLSVALAGPKGKGVVHANPHASPHANPHVNPPGRSASALANSSVNPAGVVIGAGGIKVNGAGSVANRSANLISGKITSTGTMTSLNGCVVMTVGDGLFLGRPGSDVVVKIDSLVANNPATSELKNKSKIHASDGRMVLAAGDVFSMAIGDLGSLSASGSMDQSEYPVPIGAKGENPVHGGQGKKYPDGNPGGGNGKGRWGKGNKGNGVGNIWTGNQGRGIGEGMAGGSRPEPPEPPGPEPPGPGIPPVLFIEAAPLPEIVVPGVEETEFGEGGCPALMVCLAEEIGLPAEDIQIYVANTFVMSTDIQPCEMAARLKDAAVILRDTDGAMIAALAQVVNEFVATPAPPSEEQMASISQALALYRDTDDKPHYAAAGQWLDALAEYVGILNTEIGWSVDESVAFVADKYVAPAIEGSDPGLVMFVQMRLQALGGS